MRNPALDHVFYALSAAADHSKLWHGLAWLRGVATGRTDDARRMSTALGIESFVTNVVVKSAIGRVRPDAARPSTGRFRTACACRSRARSRRVTRPPRSPPRSSSPTTTLLAPLWFGLAGAVAFSRVYVRMHHASDVVAGAAFGLVLGPGTAPDRSAHADVGDSVPTHRRRTATTPTAEPREPRP